MNRITARVVLVRAGSNDDLSKKEHATIQVELDGVVEVAAAIQAGDEVAVEIYEMPASVVHSGS